MDLDQLTGRYRRLKGELARACAEQPWPAGRIDRLALDISEAELAIAAMGAQSPGSATVGQRTTRTVPVARNRLTPFGQGVSETAGE